MSTASFADIEKLKRSNPRIFKRPWPERLRDGLMWLVFLAVLAFGFWWIDASPMRVMNGLNKLGMLVRLMIPPWPGDGLLDYVRAMLETLAIAFLGTMIAAVIAVPLGFLGAKNIVPRKAIASVSNMAWT